jgi:radical SAM protein with 4Fe4S-binding SPASM domain
MSERAALPVIGPGEAERELLAGADAWGRTDGAVLAPLAVEIQPTAHCHRTCAFCSHIIRNRRGGQLSHDEVCSLLRELEAMGVRRIAFSGGGEPLHWAAGRLVEAVEAAAGFASVSLTTSGDQLRDPERGVLSPAALVLMERCATMYFNIPAVDEASFARQVKGPTGWAHTSAMLRALVALRRGDPERFRCELHAVVVVSRFNVHQVAGIDATLVALGVDAIYYKQWKNFEGRRVERVRLDDEELLQTLEAIPPAQRSRDLSRFVALLRTEFPAGAHCWVNRLGYNAIVDPDGDIYLCTPTVGMPEYSIGNLDDGGFTTCWTGAVRSEMLRRLNGLSYDGCCPRECRHHPDNVRIGQMVQARA